MAKFLVIGGDGLLGSAVSVALADMDHEVEFTSRRPGALNRLDLSEDISGWTPPIGVHAAFLFAAVSGIDACEQSPEATRRINVDNTVLIARKLLDAGCRVVFPSTSLVFDGTVPLPDEDAPRTPITEYGRQKAEAEERLLALGDGVFVIRYTKVADFPMPLLANWRRSLKAGKEVAPFEDMYFAPVPVDFAVEATVRVAHGRGFGVWHVSADREMAYADAARLIARDLGVDESLVKGCTVASAGRNLPAPRYVALGSERLREKLGMIPPALEQLIREASVAR